MRRAGSRIRVGEPRDAERRVVVRIDRSVAVDVLDSTRDATAALDNSGTEFKKGDAKAIVFSTGAVAWTLTAATLGLASDRNNSAWDFVLALFAIDRHDDPTGKALATATESARLDKKGNYYTSSLAGDGFALTVSTTYAFMLTGKKGNDKFEWLACSPGVKEAPPVNDVPEPGSLALLGLGLCGLAASRRRKA